mgnify:CR=1 FL=1
MSCSSRKSLLGNFGERTSRWFTLARATCSPLFKRLGRLLSSTNPALSNAVSNMGVQPPVSSRSKPSRNLLLFLQRRSQYTPESVLLSGFADHARPCVIVRLPDSTLLTVQHVNRRVHLLARAETACEVSGNLRLRPRDLHGKSLKLLISSLPAGT